MAINPRTGKSYLTDEETLKRIRERLAAAKAENQAFFGDADVGEVSRLGNALNVSGFGELYDYMQQRNISNIPELREHVQSIQPQSTKPVVEYTAPVQTQYTSPYQEQIDALLKEILNYKPFTYDVESDPMYQAYKKRYQQAGEESFQNVIGDLAGMTGGRLNTWAISSASQARQAWDERLMDVIPELYNLAYEMYSKELSNKYNQLAALGGLESRDYERYRDTIEDLRYQQEFAYKQLQDKLAQERYEKEWEYGVERDKLADERYLQEWLHQLEREKKEDERYEREWEHMLSQEEYDRLTQKEKEDYERYWREKMWDYQVTQDEYERMSKAEQKAYDRAWQQKMFEYGVTQDELNRAERAEERAYQRYLDLLKFKQKEPPTAGQLANYHQILQGLLSNFDSTADALYYVNRIGKQQYVDLIGENLYNQLLQELQSKSPEDDIPALYYDMMSPYVLDPKTNKPLLDENGNPIPNDPKTWLRENSIFLNPTELKELERYTRDNDYATYEELKRMFEDVLKNR